LRHLLTYLFLGITCSAFSTASNHTYFEITAGNGAGVYSLLNKYDLFGSNCNQRQFYKLNKLKPNQGLIKGKKYKLPLLEYKYNGTSIRSTIDSNDMDFAIMIKNYNDGLVARGIKSKSYTKDKQLLIPYSMLYCGTKPKTVLAAAKPKKSFKNINLFGKEYAKTEIIDQSLKGKVFYVVAGHGGPDPGSMGEAYGNQLCEDEYAYDVSLRLTRELIQHGAIAYMINRDNNDGIRDDKYLECDYDEKVIGGIEMSRNQIIRLRQRSGAVNKLYNKHRRQGIKSQTLISVHIDSRHANQKADVFFYHHTKSVKGNHLADRMMAVFDEKYKKYQSSRGYKGKVQGRNLQVLRESKPLAVFVELGNIQNAHDQKRFLFKENRQLLAEWLFEGLITAP